MSSTVWLQQEAQPSGAGAFPQPPMSGPTGDPPTPGHPTPVTTTPCPGTGPPTPRSQDQNGTTSETTHESVRVNFVNSPGYVVPAPSFSYNVIPKINNASGNSQQPVLKSNSPASTTALQPPAPGQSSAIAPSFSYNIVSQVNISPANGPQPHTDNDGPGHAQGGKFTPLTTAASLQPPAPGQSGFPNSFVPGAAAVNMPAPALTPFSVPKGHTSIAAGFSYNRSLPPTAEASQKNQFSSSNTSAAVEKEADNDHPALSSSQTMPLPVHTTSSSSSVLPTAPNSHPATIWRQNAPSFSAPPGMLGTLRPPGPAGIPSSASLPSNITVQPVAVDSSSASFRPMPSQASLPSNTAAVGVSQKFQQHMFSPYPSLPANAPPPQAFWMHPPQVGGLPGPPFLPYHGIFSGPYPLPVSGMVPPSVPLPDPKPPGVSPIEPPGGVSPATVGSGIVSSNLGAQSPPPGIGQDKQANDPTSKDEGIARKDDMDTWTAHKTETGVVYYYNALTGESTYEKPTNFKGEPDQVTVQPTPVSWDKLPGTDWTLVTTNDGKKYYYNAQTKVSSWQVPLEVAELRKKQDSDSLKLNMTLVPNASTPADKGSAAVSLSASTVNTVARDATALRISGALVSSSALDLIKKKLQDAGTPITSSPLAAASAPTASDLNGPKSTEVAVKGQQSENSRDKLKDGNGDGNISDSSSDSDDVDSGPTKECIIQFKEMLKERGVAPFSKWEKELPKILFDPRFKAVPGYSTRRSLFEHYVRTRAEEERKEKRAAQKSAIEGFKQLLEEASEDIDHETDYQSFKRKWGSDPRFEALDCKERQVLLNEKVLPLKKKAQAIRAASVSSFKSMLQDKGDITTSSRWSRVKDSLRSDPRYRSVKHEEREILFYQYISELKAKEQEAERAAKAKREEQEKIKERERETRKRKEREEQEMDRVRLKVRRMEAAASYQALLVETIKEPKASWTESKPKLEKDPQGRATNPDLEKDDTEKLFREHVKILYERCVRDFRALLAEVITVECAAQVTEEGKTALTSWSTAKKLLKPDPRYSKMPRKERESLWQRHSEEMQRKLKSTSDAREEKPSTEGRSRAPADSSRRSPSARRTHGRR